MGLFDANKRARGGKQDGFTAAGRPSRRVKPAVEVMEPRVMLSIAQAADPVALGLARPAVVADAKLTGPVAPVRQVVAIDAGLARGGLLPAKSGPDTRVVLLEPGQDPLDQITAALAPLSGVTAVHVLTHGSAGAIESGAVVIDKAALKAHAAELARWSRSLADDAVVGLYGCDVAAGGTGRAFVNALARRTGAAVAASTDATGAARLGGDWALEYVTGRRTAVPAAPAVQAFDGLLAPPSVTPSAGTTAHVVGFGATPIDPGLVLSSAGGSAGLTTAAVRIAAGYRTGEDVLALPATAGYADSFDATTGTLTITSGAARIPAEFEAVLRTVTYRNTQTPLATLGTRGIVFEADGTTSAAKNLTPDLPVDAAAQARIVDALQVIDAIGQRIAALPGTPFQGDTTAVPLTGATVTDLLYPTSDALDTSGNRTPDYGSSIQPQGIGAYLRLRAAAADYFAAAGTLTDLTGLEAALEAELAAVVPGTTATRDVAATFAKPAGTDAGRRIDLTVTIATTKGRDKPLVLDMLRRDLALTLPGNPTVTVGGGADIQLTIGIDLQGHVYDPAPAAIPQGKVNVGFSRLNAVAGFTLDNLNTPVEIGSLRGQIVGGSGVVGASFPVGFGTGGASRTLDRWATDGSDVAGFSQRTGTAGVTLPITAAIGGTAVSSADTRVVISDSDLFDGRDPTYTTDEFDNLLYFSTVQIEDVIQEVLKVGAVYDALDTSDASLFGVQVPFLKDTRLGTLFDFKSLFDSQIGSQVDVHEPVLNTPGRDELTDYRLPVSEDTDPKPSMTSDLRGGFRFGVVVNNRPGVTTVTVPADAGRSKLDDLVVDVSAALTAAGVHLTAFNNDGKMSLKAGDGTVQSFAIVPVAPDAGRLSPAAAPGDLSTLPPNAPQYFTVTGSTAGSVTGTNYYTVGSPLAAAAVHAGLLGAGETGVVKVTRVGATGALWGSTRHGVTSAGAGLAGDAYLVESAANDLRRLGIVRYSDSLTVLEAVSGGAATATLPFQADLPGAGEIALTAGGQTVAVSVPDNNRADLAAALGDVQAALAAAGVAAGNLSARLVDAAGNALAGAPQSATDYYLQLYLPTGSAWTTFSLAPTGDATAYRVLPLGFLSGDVSAQPRPAALRTFQDFTDPTLFPHLTITPAYDAAAQTVTLQFTASATRTPAEAAAFDFAVRHLGRLTADNPNLSFTPTVTSNLSFGLAFKIGPSNPISLTGGTALPADGRLAGTAQFNLDLAPQRPFTITVPQAWTTANADAQDLIGDVNRALQQAAPGAGGGPVDLTNGLLVARRGLGGGGLELVTAGPANGGAAIAVANTGGRITQDAAVPFAAGGKHYVLTLKAADTATNAGPADLVADLNQALSAAVYDADGDGQVTADDPVVSLAAELFFTTVSTSAGASTGQFQLFSTSPDGAAWPTAITLTAARTNAAVTALGFDDGAGGDAVTVTGQASGVRATLRNVGSNPLAGGAVQLNVPTFSGSVPYGFNTLRFTGTSGGVVSALATARLKSGAEGSVEDVADDLADRFDRTLSRTGGPASAYAALTLTGVSAAGATVSPSATVRISLPDLSAETALVDAPVGVPIPVPNAAATETTDADGLPVVTPTGKLTADADVTFLYNAAAYTVSVSQASAAGNADFAALAAQFNAALAGATREADGATATGVDVGGQFTIAPTADGQLQVTAKTDTANPDYATGALLPDIDAFGAVGVQGSFGLATVADALQATLPVLDKLQSGLDLFSAFKLPLIDAKVNTLIDVKGDLADRLVAFRDAAVTSADQLAPALAAAMGVPADHVRVTFDAAAKAYRIDLQYDTSAKTDLPLNLTLADYYRFTGGNPPAALAQLTDVGSESPVTVKLAATTVLSVGIDLTDPDNPRTFLYAHDGTGDLTLADGTANGTSIQVAVSAAADGIDFTALAGTVGVYARGGSAVLGGPAVTQGGHAVYAYDADGKQIHLVRQSDAAGLTVGLGHAAHTRYYLSPRAGEGDALALGAYDAAFAGSAEVNLPLFTPTEFENKFGDLTASVRIQGAGQRPVTLGGNVFRLHLPDLGAFAAATTRIAALNDQIAGIYLDAAGRNLNPSEQTQANTLRQQVSAAAAGGAVDVFTPDPDAVNAGLPKATVTTALANPSVLVDGIDSALGAVESGLRTLDNLDLPVIGPVLGSAVRNVFGWRQAWLSNLKYAMRGQGDGVFQAMKESIYDSLGPAGLNLLLKDNGIRSVAGMVPAAGPDDVGLHFVDSDGGAIQGPDTQDAQAVEFKVRLGSVLVDTGADLGFNFDALAPALTLAIDGGLTFKLGWDMTIGFGYSLRDGFYVVVDDDPAANELELRFEAGLSGPQKDFVVAARGASPTGYSIKDKDGNWVLGPADGNGHRDVLNVLSVNRQGQAVTLPPGQDPMPDPCDDTTAADPVYWVVAAEGPGHAWVPAYLDKLGGYRPQAGSDWLAENGNSPSRDPDRMVQFNQTAPFSALGSLFALNLTAVDQIQTGLEPPGDGDYFYDPKIPGASPITSDGRNNPLYGVNRNNALPTRIAGPIGVNLDDPSGGSEFYTVGSGPTVTGKMLMDGIDAQGGKPVLDRFGNFIPVGAYNGGYYVMALRANATNPTDLSQYEPVREIHTDVSPDRITFLELQQQNHKVIDLRAEVEAVVNLSTTLSISDSAAVPKLTADFNLDWRSDSVKPPASPFEEDKKKKLDLVPEVGLNNIRLDLGSALTQVIGPIARKIDAAMDPLDPVLDALQTEIPIISDIAGRPIRLSTLLIAFGGSKGAALGNFIDMVTAVRDVAGVMAGIPAGANVYLPVGNFWLAKVGAGPAGKPGLGRQIYYDNSEIRAPSATQRNQSLLGDPGAGKNAIVGALGSLDTLDSGMNPALARQGLTNRTQPGGFRFPILQDPLTVFKLLTGQDVPLVTFSLPKLDYTFTQDIPLVKILILEVGLRLQFKLHTQFDVGYDTYGVRLYKESHNPADVLQGFYVNDRANPDGTGPDVDELNASASLGLYGGINVVLAKAGIEGGLKFTADVNLNDPNNDGKLRVMEAVDLVKYTGNPLDLADIKLGAEVYARYYYWVGIDVGFFSITLFEGGDTFARLPLFTITREGNDGPPTVASLVTTQGPNREDLDHTLLVHVGPNAAKRVSNQDPYKAEDRAESVTITNAAAGSGDVTVVYRAGGQSWSESFSGVKRVVALGGDGNDLIDASGLRGLPVEFSGGSGNDTLRLGSGPVTGTEVAYLRGDDGNDTITVTGGGRVRLDGGGGNDSLTAGSGDATIDPGEGNDAVTGGGAGSTNRLVFAGGGFGLDVLTLSPTATANVLDFTAAALPLTADLAGAGSVLSAGDLNRVLVDLAAVTEIRGTDARDVFNITNPTTRAASAGRGLVLRGGQGNDEYNVTADDLSGVSGDGVTIDDGLYPTARAAVGPVDVDPDCGHIRFIHLAAGGAGYTTPPEVLITDPTGAGARAVASLDETGAVAAVTLISKGEGYTHPTVTLVDPVSTTDKLTYTSATAGTVTLDRGGNGGADYELSRGGKSIKWVGWAQPGTVRPAGYGVSEVDNVAVTLPAGTLSLDAHLDVLDAVTVAARRLDQNAPVTADTVKVTTEHGFAADFPIQTTNNGDILLRTTGKNIPTYTGQFAAATATVANGRVTAVTVTSAGNYYDFPPTVTLVDGHGTGARAVAAVSNGRVTGITVLDGGSGYVTTPAPRVVISQPASIQLNTNVSTSTVGSAPGTGDGRGTVTLRSEVGSIDNSGDVLFPDNSHVAWEQGDYHYTSTDTLADITPARYPATAGGQGAAARAVLDADGRVTAIQVLNGGSGYSSALLPGVRIEGAATATAVVDGGGRVTGFRVTFPGEGYAVAPKVTVLPNGFGKLVGADSAATALDRAHIKSAGGSLVAAAYYGIGDPSKPIKTDVENMVAQTLGLAAGIHVLEKDGVRIGLIDNINGLHTAGGDVSVTTFGGAIELGQPVQQRDAAGNLLWEDAAKTIPIYERNDDGSIIYEGGQLAAGTGEIKLTADDVDVNSFVSAGGGRLVLQPVTAEADIGLNGTRARGVAALAGGRVTAVNFAQGADGFIYDGRGYTAEPIVTLTPPGQRAFAVASVLSGEVTGVRVTFGGTRYNAAHPPAVTFVGGGVNGATPAHPATAVAAYDADGTVTGITLTGGGAGYQTAPEIRIALPGEQATARAVVGPDGHLTGFQVVTPGSNYAVAPAVIVAAPYAFSLEGEEINYFQDGFDDVVIGRADGRHTFHAADATFHDDLTLRAPKAGTLQAESVTVTNGTLSVVGSGHTFHLSLDGPAVASENVDIDDNVSIDNGVAGTLTATVGYVRVYGTGKGNIDGVGGLAPGQAAGDLTITAVTDVLVAGSVGGVNPIHTLNINSTGGGNVNLQQNVTLTGDLHITRGNNIAVGGNVVVGGNLVIDEGASISFNGTVTVGGDLVVAKATTVTFAQNVSVGGNLAVGNANDPSKITSVTFGPTARLDVDGVAEIYSTDSIVFGNRVGQVLQPSAAVLRSETGDVSFQGAVNAAGGTITVRKARDVTFAQELTADALDVQNATAQTRFQRNAALGTMTVTSTTLVQVANGLTLTSGSGTITSDQVAFDGGNGSVQYTGSGTSTLTIQPRTVSRAITLGSPPGVFTSLDLSDVDVAAVAGGFTEVVIGDAAAGTGAVTIGSIGSQQGAGNSQLLNSTSVYGGSVNVVQGVDSSAAEGFLRLVARTGNVTVGATINGTAAERSDVVQLQALAGSVLLNQPVYAAAELRLIAAGPVTEGAGAFFNAPALRVSAGGAVTLLHAGNVTATVAMDAGNNPIYLRKDGDFAVGTVDGVSGINTGAADTRVTSHGGTVSQSQPVTAGGLLLTGTGTAFVLTHPANHVATLAAAARQLAYSDAGSTAVGSVGGTNGVTTTGAVAVTAAANLAVTQPIATTIDGTVALGATAGTLTLAAAGDATAARGVALAAPAGITTAGDVTTAAEGVTYTGPVTLSGNVAVDTHAGAGTVAFTGPVNGSGGLTLTAGAGQIDWQGPVGASTPLAYLTTTAAAAALAGNVTTAGPLSVTAPAIRVNGTIETGGGALSLLGTVALQGDTRLSTGTAAGNLTVTAVTGNGHNLRLMSGGGTTTITGDLTGVATLGLQDDVAASTGAVSLRGNVSINTLATVGRGYAVGLTGATNQVATATAFRNTGPVTVGDAAADAFQFPAGLSTAGNPTNPSVTTLAGTITTAAQPVRLGNTTLAGNAALDTTAAGTAPGADVTFTGTVDGGSNLSVTAGPGDVTFAGAVGGTVGLGQLTVAGAADFTAAAVSAAGIRQTAGTGTTTLAALTAGAGGIDLTGNVFALNGPVTTTAGGAVTFRNAGTLTIAASAPLTLDGPLTQAGAGAVSWAAGVTTTGDAVSFAAPVALAADVTLATASGAVTFQAAVTGSRALTLDAGTGDVSFAGAVGTLTCLAVQHAGHVTFAHALGVGAGGLAVTSDDVIDFNGPATSAGPVALTAGNAGHTGTIHVNGDFTITAGDFTVDHDGTLTFHDGITLDIAGTTRFVGPGRVVFGAVTYRTHDADVIFDHGPVQLTADTVIDTGGGIGNVVFKDEVRGAHDLVIRANGGTVVFEKAVGGGGAPLSELRITGAEGVAFFRSVNVAGELALEAADGVTLGGNVAATGDTTITAGGSVTAGGTVSAGGDLLVTSGANATFHKPVTAGGDATFAHAGTLQFAAGADIQTHGAFAEQGPGPVVLEALALSTAGHVAAFIGDVTLAGDVAVSTGAGGVTFAGPVDGEQALTLTTTGDVYLAAVGQSAPLAAVVLQGGADVTVSGALAAGHVTQTGGTGTTTLGGAVAATDSTGVSLQTGAVVVAAPVVTAAGPVTLTATGGQSVGAGVDSPGPAAMPGELKIAPAGSIDSAGRVTLTAGSLTLENGAAVTAGNGADVVVTADAVDLGSAPNAVNGTGLLVLQPATGGRRIDVGAAGPEFDLTTGELAAVGGGFGRILIGRGRGDGFDSGDDGSHAVVVHDAAFRSDVVVRAPGAGGTVTVAGALTTYLQADGITLVSGGDLRVDGSVAANGAGDVTLTADADRDTAGALVVAGSTAAAVTAAGGQVTLSGPQVRIGSDSSAGSVTSPRGSVVIVNPTAGGSVEVKNPASVLSAGNEVRIGVDGGVRPAAVRLEGDLAAGGDILVRSGGDVALTHFRHHAVGHVEVLADGNLTATDGTSIAQGGPVTLAADADHNGTGAATQTAVRVSEPSPVALDVSLAGVKLAGMLRAGDRGSAYLVVTNRGGSRVEKYIDLYVYATADNKLGADDRMIGSLNRLVRLNRGQSKRIKVPLLVPPDLRPGDYHVAAELLPYHQMVAAAPDGSAVGNIAITPRTYSVRLADLVGTVTSTLDGKTLAAGGRGRAAVTLTNQGEVRAYGPVDVTVYASPGGDMTGAVLLGKVQGKGLNLKPGASKHLKVGLTLPPSLAAPGSYRLVAVMNDNTGFAEADTDNNAPASAVPFTLAA